MFDIYMGCSLKYNNYTAIDEDPINITIKYL